MSSRGGQREKRNRHFEAVAAAECLRDQPITHFEFGVHKGESIRWWVENNRNADSRFYGFDSFEGLPENWQGVRSKGAFDLGGVAPEAVDQRCEFVKGWFHETLPYRLAPLSESRRRVLHLDGDLYRSTVYPLLVCGPALRDKDIVIFDEFADSAHEFRAFEDFLVIFGFEAQPLTATRGFMQTSFLLRSPGAR